MFRYRFLYLIPILIVIACNNKPQETSPLQSNQQKGSVVGPQESSDESLAKIKRPTITKYTTEVWTGRTNTYCSLRLLDPVKGFAENIESLIKNNQYQEAIWLLEERGISEKEKATKLKDKLTQLYTSGEYKVIPNKLGGTVVKYLFEFEGGILGLYKSAANDFWWANEKSEVAAYQLDQLLNFNLVPLTILRTVNGDNGSIQYFFTVVENGDPGHTASRNFAALKVFDYISGNKDRSFNNFLYWSQQDRVIAIDNGASFKDYQCGEAAEIKSYLELVPTLKNRINNIHDEEVKAALTHYLSQNEIESVIGRINTLKDQTSSKRASY